MTTDAKTTRLTSVGRMLNLLTRKLNAEMNTRLKPMGLGLPEFAILMTLLELEGQTQSELGKKTAIPAHGTTRSIDALEALDLVERRNDPTSRRSHRIFLTAKGHQIGPQLFAIVTEVNGWLLDGLGKAEKQAFAVTLAKIL
ncbi:MAG: MarR family transcriptional regulator [Marinosulfonomonas sp.]|nr:MarR family transcriptional regulator [Marinosulfonomonas sp.]